MTLNMFTHLIQTHKLPALEELNIYGNRLWRMETDVGHLIEACVTHHQRELELVLWGNDLSWELENEWRQRCEGTNIEPHFNIFQ